MKIIIINGDFIEEWIEKKGLEVSPNELTDEQFLEIYDKYAEDCWVYTSWESFVKGFNENPFFPSPEFYYMRVFNN